MGWGRCVLLFFFFQVIFVSSSSGESDAEYSLRQSALAKGRSFIVTKQQLSDIDEARLIDTLKSFRGVSYARVSPGIFKFSSADQGKLEAIKKTLRAAGFDVEVNQSVAFLAGGGGVVNDPDASATMYFGPTEVARTPYQNNLTAFDYTRGDYSVGIGVIDTPRDAFESALAPLEMAPGFSLLEGVPSFSHGTQVSYVIHGQPNGQYSFGICPGCTRVFAALDFGQGASNPTAVIDGAVFAIDAMTRMPALGPDIINMSWGAPLESPALAKVIRDAYLSGVSLVSAAGNSALPAPIYPASSPHVIGVGSSGDFQVASSGAIAFNPSIISGFSNRGADIVAPGSNVKLPDASSSTPIMTYMDGTSFASPYVAGSLGLIRSYFMEHKNQFPFIQLMSRFERARYFENLLLTNTDDLGSGGFDEVFGAGRVNPRRAIAALIADGQAEANQLAPGLTRGIVEWGTTRRVIDLANAKIQQGSPITKMIVNLGPFQVGGCWDPAAGYSKIKLSRPRLAISVSGASLNVVSAVGDTLEIEYSAHVAYTGYVRVKVFGPMECLLGLPGLENTISFAMVPSGSSASIQRYRFKYLLRTAGYELDSVSKDVQPLEFSVGIGHMPAVLNQALKQVIRKLGDDLLSVVSDFLDMPIRAQAGSMVDKILTASLPQERLSPFGYYDRRRGVDGNHPMSVKLNGSGSSATHVGSGNRTVSRIRAKRPASGIQPVLPTSAPVSFGTTTDESEVVSHKNVLNAQLAQLFGDQAFNYLADSQVANSGTELAPGGVAFSFSNVRALNSPTVVPSTLGSGGAEIQAVFGAQLVVNNTFSPATITYRVPISKASMYKGSTIETVGLLDSAYYEERIVPDATGAKIQVVLEDRVAKPIINSAATDEDIGILFHYLYGLKTLRKFSALSVASNHLNVMLGDHWGCYFDVIESANYAYRLITESQGLRPQELLIPEEISGCFDLNIGYFAPQHSPEVVMTSAQRAVKVNFAERKAAKEPMTDLRTLPRAGLEVRQFPNGQGRGYRVEAKIVPQPINDSLKEPAGELQTSMDGLYRTAFEGDQSGVKKVESVSFVQHIWQLGRGLGTREHPLVLLPNSGGIVEFKVIGIGRNLKELNRQANCLPYVNVKFRYDLGGLLPPVVTYGHGGGYQELPITAPRDLMNTGACPADPLPHAVSVEDALGKGSSSQGEELSGINSVRPPRNLRD